MKRALTFPIILLALPLLVVYYVVGAVLSLLAICTPGWDLQELLPEWFEKRTDP